MDQEWVQKYLNREKEFNQKKQELLEDQLKIMHLKKEAEELRLKIAFHEEVRDARYAKNKNNHK